MSRRTHLLLSTLLLGMAGCNEKTVVGEITHLVERCWRYWDNGNSPGRGLSRLHGSDSVNTREDHGAKLPVIYEGTSLDDLACDATNREIAWSLADHEEKQTDFISVVTGRGAVLR